eukprot:1183584-Prorocentrum_minimum.AAC.9
MRCALTTRDPERRPTSLVVEPTFRVSIEGVDNGGATTTHRRRDEQTARKGRLASRETQEFHPTVQWANSAEFK